MARYVPTCRTCGGPDYVPHDHEGEMKTPIDMMLDGVVWKPLGDMTEVPRSEESLPYATHEGELLIGDLTMKVYQLSNGQRLISEEGVEAFLRYLGAD